MEVRIPSQGVAAESAGQRGQSALEAKLFFFRETFALRAKWGEREGWGRGRGGGGGRAGEGDERWR